MHQENGRCRGETEISGHDEFNGRGSGKPAPRARHGSDFDEIDDDDWAPSKKAAPKKTIPAAKKVRPAGGGSSLYAPCGTLHFTRHEFRTVYALTARRTRASPCPRLGGRQAQAVFCGQEALAATKEDNQD